MKSFIFLVISLVFSLTFTSTAQKTSEISRSITLQATGNNVGPALLKQSADIITARLKHFGINSFEINVSADNGQLKILLPDKIDLSEIEGLLTSKGELAFYETYIHDEIIALLNPDNQLFQLLNQDQEQKPFDPRIGCTSSENQKKVDEYIRSAPSIKNCKLLWDAGSEKSGYCLFALKINNDGKALLVRSDIESVRIALGSVPQDRKIHIKLKPSAITLFADATRNNLNKAIAIVIDDRVYSWPVVRSVIGEGDVEVTGNFTEKEANYLPVLFSSEQLPFSFKILK